MKKSIKYMFVGNINHGFVYLPLRPVTIKGKQYYRSADLDITYPDYKVKETLNEKEKAVFIESQNMILRVQYKLDQRKYGENPYEFKEYTIADFDAIIEDIRKED